MAGLMDFFQNPNVALAAGLLSPTPNQNLGQALTQGLRLQREQALSQLRGQILQAEVERFQQQALARQAQQAALQNITQQLPVPLANPGGGFTARNVNQNIGRTQSMLERDPQAAARQVIGSGDITGGLGLLKAFQPSGGAVGSVNPANFTPSSLQRFAQTNNFADLVPVPKVPLVQNVFGSQPLSVNDSLKFIDDQGNHPEPGTTLQEANQEGFVLKSTEQQKLEGSSAGALAFIDRLEALAFDKENPVFTGFSGTIGRARQGASNLQALASQGNQNLTLYKDLSDSGLSIIVRALGEKGSLTEDDITRIRNAIPQVSPLPDSPEIARKKIQTLRGIINEVSGRKSGTGQQVVEVDGAFFVIGADGQPRQVIEE